VYLHQAQQSPDRYRVINAAQPLDHVQQRLGAVLDEFLRRP
jgi:dTMP kinase